MSTYHENLQGIVRAYQDAGERWPASSKDIAAWAINNGLWKPKPSSIISQCANHISEALRDEYITDPQGRRVRAKHVATVLEYGETRRLWGDIRTAPRQHMQLAFQQRRQQIVGDCKQLKVDVDSYNENANPEKSIQMIFDFTRDLREFEAAANY
jgi:hypothetical protein